MGNINNTLNTLSNVANTIFNFATYDWTKEKLVRLAVVGGLFVTAAVVVKYVDTKCPETK